MISIWINMSWQNQVFCLYKDGGWALEDKEYKKKFLISTREKDRRWQKTELNPTYVYELFPP